MESHCLRDMKEYNVAFTMECDDGKKNSLAGGESQMGRQ